MLNRRTFAAAAAAGGWLGPRAARAQPSSVVTLAYTENHEGKVCLPVTVAGVAGLATLDNGAPRTIIDAAFAQTHGLLTGDRDFLSQVRDVPISLGGFDWRVTTGTLDLTQGPGAHTPLIAIIGAEFFAAHIVQIDFVGGLVSIFDRAGFWAPAGFTQMAVTSPRGSGDVRFTGRVEDVEGLGIVLDLGGSAQALVKPGPLANRLVASRPSIGQSIAHYEASGSLLPIDTRTFSVREIAFAGFSLTDVPMTVGAANMPPGAAMQLDIGALSRFDLIFDTGGRRLWMRPNIRYGQPFPFQLYGRLSMTLGPMPGTLRVTGVEAGSPASRAGLKAGDLIIAVNGLPAVPSNLAVLEQGAQEVGDQLVLDLDGGRTVTVTATRYY